MPHVASQMRSSDRPRESVSRHTPTTRSPYEYRRPATASPQTQTTRAMPNLDLLAIPNSGRRQHGSSPHQRQYSADPLTPISATDSVFEAYSADPLDSPNSSTHSFIAELEDTSYIATSAQQAVSICSKFPAQTTSSLVCSSPVSPDLSHSIFNQH